MSGGPFDFTTTKPFQDDPLCVLNGLTINARSSMTKTPSAGANVVEMFDNSRQVQLDYRDSAYPEVLQFYSFHTGQRAVTETAWWAAKEATKRGRPLVLIDYDYEVEVFIAGPELENFRLPRATAKSLWSGFPITYAPYVTLNGAAQTVVESGTPGAGEVKIVGAAATTPALTVGDELIVRYVPGFYVVITEMPQDFAGSNDLTRSLTFVETRAFG